MSLTARCPACATLFRVVPDQLKISDGWVRCGQCSEVFDAQAALEPPVQAPAAPSIEAPVPVTVPDTLPQTEPKPEPKPEPEPEPEPAVVMEVEVVVPSEAPEPVLESGPLPGDASAVTSDPAPSDPLLFSPLLSQIDPPLDPQPIPAPDATPLLHGMAFVRQARYQAFWRSRGVRWGLGVLAGVLGLVLAGQIVFHHRDRLASQVPALQPALAALCAWRQCRLGPPKRIESITIESSAFTRVRADAFRLSLTLSNQADIALAMPALELTLTDLQDQPVLRRVLQPVDLDPAALQSIAPRTEWTSTLTLVVAPAANPARIVGYRVLAFYP